ncbi:phage portal protein [Dermabacteraceae bacterium P13077]
MTTGYWGLSAAEQRLHDRCLRQLDAASRANRRRTDYYELKHFAEHMDISVPPQMKRIATVLGWPAKAVDMLEARINLDGMVLPERGPEDYGLDLVWADNRLDIEATQAHTSALKYGVSFLAVMAGQEGEPDVVVRALSPVNSTVLWDRNRRRAVAALIVEKDETQAVSRVCLLTDTDSVYIDPSRKRVVERVPHKMGRVPVAVLPFKPSLESMFGRSRISQAVMSITDRAVRTLLRSEVGAEFYASPQRYLLGADASQFVGADGERADRWSAVMSRILAIPFDEDGNRPEVGSFPQMTMQPHLDMLRSDAALFAGETDIPVNALGIIHDNPASDAAMQSAYLALNNHAERAHATFGAGWVDAMQLAWLAMNPGEKLPVDLRRMKAHFRDPATPTMAARAQAVTAQVQAGVLPAASEVTYELLGYDRITVDRLMQESRQAANERVLSDLVQRDPAAREQARMYLPEGSDLP